MTSSPAKVFINRAAEALRKLRATEKYKLKFPQWSFTRVLNFTARELEDVWFLIANRQSLMIDIHYSSH